MGTDSQAQVSHRSVHLELSDQGTILWDQKRKQRLLLFEIHHAMMPVINGSLSALKDFEVSSSADSIVVSGSNDDLSHYESNWAIRENRIEVSVSLIPKANSELNEMALLSPGSAVNFYDVVNFRNRHFASPSWPEYNLGEANQSTSTYSGDWQFAPHPSMLVFRKGETQLLVGTQQLSHSFGLYLSTSRFKIHHCYLNFGSESVGQQLEAGVRYTPASFIFILGRSNDVHRLIEEYVGQLSTERIITNPEERHAWHREPLYCTWLDQVALSKSAILIGPCFSYHVV